MILFFYGEDTYRLRQKLNALKEKFVTSSLGDTNMAVLSGKTITYEEIVRQILAMPFLAKKRLVIIENFIHDGKKEVQEKFIEFLKKIPESTVLVLVEEGNADKRTSLYKKLNLPGKAQEFKLLDEEPLKRWIKKEVDMRGGQIDSASTNLLVEYVGNDLWRMSNELDKLVAYNKRLIVENIKLLVQPRVQSNIFTLIEAAAAKEPKRAIHELYKLFNDGAAEIYILTMIVFQYRNLLIVKDFEERSPQSSRWELAKKTGLHPFVLGKTMQVSHKYTFGYLKKIYARLLHFESAIKVGRIEPMLALELLVFELTR